MIIITHTCTLRDARHLIADQGVTLKSVTIIAIIDNCIYVRTVCTFQKSNKKYMYKLNYIVKKNTFESQLDTCHISNSTYVQRKFTTMKTNESKHKHISNITNTMSFSHTQSTHTDKYIYVQ